MWPLMAALALKLSKFARYRSSPDRDAREKVWNLVLRRRSRRRVNLVRAVEVDMWDAVEHG